MPGGSHLKKKLAAGLLIGGLVLSGCGGSAKRSSTESAVQGKILFAERLIQAGSYPEAQKMLTDAQRLEPNNPQVHYYQGVVNFSIGDLPAAEKSLNESIRFNKRNPDAHNVLGLVYKQRGDYQRAMSEYQIAIDDPTFAAKE